MNNKYLAVIVFFMFAGILIAPFYTNLPFLSTFTAYITSFFWFLIIAVVGFKSLLSIFLVVLYAILVTIIMSFTVNKTFILNMSLGVISAIITFFATGMHKNEK